MGGSDGEWRCRRRRAIARRLVGGATAIAALAAGLGWVQPTVIAMGSTFVVDSTGDSSDLSSSDGVCLTAVSTCTLRAAIQQANATAGHDRIEFDIVGPPTQVHTIQPATALPIISDGDGVTIDGYSQNGAAVNTLDHGSNALIRIELRGDGSSGMDGLYIQSSDNVVTGLALFDFRVAVRFWAATGNVEAERNLVVGNFIGTNAAGTFVAPGMTSSGDGVHLQQNAAHNHIGAPGNANRNVISGSSGRGVGMFNPGSDHNVVENNIIGLDPSGTTPLKNWSHGVDINYGSSHNTVTDNVISGNGLSGVEISHDALGAQYGHGGTGHTELNVVSGNRIGTDPTGLVAPATFGNGEYGVGLEGRGLCQLSCPPDSNDNEVVGNVIVGSDTNVKIWRGSHENVVRDNWIGVLADGVTGSDHATERGVLIEVGSIHNLVEDNVIAEVGTGVVVRPTSENPGDTMFAVFGNTLRGNSIDVLGSGLGVDLAPGGSPTASPDPSMVQNGVGIGSISVASTDGVAVSACAGCIVELFETNMASPSPYGLGHTSLGLETATGGTATFAFRTDPGDPFVVDEGDVVSALVTDSTGSTSELSLRTTVSAGSVGTTPTSTTTVPPTTTTVPTTTVPPGDASRSAGTSARTDAETRPAQRCSISDRC